MSLRRARTASRTPLSKFPSPGGVTCSSLSSTSSCGSPSSSPLGSPIWSFHSSNVTVTPLSSTLIVPCLSPLVLSKSSNTCSTLALHHTFHHNWMSRKVVSVGALTLLFAALWTPFASPSGPFVSMMCASQVVFGISLPTSSAALCPRSVLGDSASQPWVDSGVTQGRVLSPFLFNLLVDNLATSLRAAVPGVRLVDSDPFRHVCQLCADDLVLLAESQAHLQDALDVVHTWCLCWRFSFGIGSTNSAVLVLGLSGTDRSRACKIGWRNTRLKKTDALPLVLRTDKKNSA